MNVKV